MKIFVPAYDCKWRCIELDSTKCRYRKHLSDSGASIDCRGVIYCGTHVFRSARGVWAYVNKDYAESRGYEINPDEINWRE